MGIFSKIFGKKDTEKRGGMEDYMTLVRVYFQAAIAENAGITNLAALPDLRMFKTTLTDGELAELKALRNLAPGDFRTVRQEQFYLGGDVTNLDRIAALKEECAVKKDGDGHAPIGFAA